MSTDHATNEAGLSREAIVAALATLSDELAKKGITGELCLFGGTVMVLAYSARMATKDVDALFQPARSVRVAAGVVAEILGLPTGWLNDGVKGFLSTNHRVVAGNLPQFEHLRLTMPVPEYLLAMKCMASRIGGTDGESSDLPDIVFLLRKLGITSASQALQVVAQYYPAERISVKTQYLLEGLYEEGKV